MSSTVANEDLVKLTYLDYIINKIKSQVPTELNDGAEPWDEEKSGVEWIDNEVGMFEDIYSLINDQESSLLTVSSSSHLTNDFDTCETVSEAKELLLKQPLKYLDALKIFMEKGGSDNPIVLVLVHEYMTHNFRVKKIKQYLTKQE